MEVYASSLSNSLSQLPEAFRLEEFRPRLPFEDLSSHAQWKMRYARYIDYPRSISIGDTDLFHITEHGYAHLIRKLPAHKTVVTVHDIIPLLRYKGMISGVGKSRRPLLGEYSIRFLRKAAHLIAISESTKKDLVDYCRCDPEKISVVYYGLPQTPVLNNSKLQARKILGLPTESTKIILVTGQDFYKNLETGIKVFQKLRNKYNKVCLAHLGRQSDLWVQAKSSLIDDKGIYEFADLPYSQVALLYKAVDCTLFPSWYEGFGLPPLESMSVGTPAVSSNVASLPEAVGPYSLTSDPDDIDGLTKHAESLLYDDAVRKYQIAQGLDYSANFTWENCAKNSYEVYKKVLYP